MIAENSVSNNSIFTSESVSEGHPDKVCDQISDSIVDLFLSRDPEARVAAESLATTNHVTIAGEVRSAEPVTHDEIIETVTSTIKNIGYEQEGFDWRTVQINNLLHEQSSDIARGVDSSDTKEEGAGDQGIMFGFACNETAEFMPAPISYASRILRSLAEDRHKGLLPELGPDAKSQVSMNYEDWKPTGASSIVVSTQHGADVSQERVREIVKSYVEKTLPEGWMCNDKELYVNPTGQFIIGGPDGDAGLTGRKIIVDTYGGAAPHGGGAFSGKDPTKVDRSAAYAARYLAKNIVAAGIAERCTIQLSYAIGVSHPISLYVSLRGEESVDRHELVRILPELMNLSPRGIREHLQLNKPIYTPSAAYGHFGRNPRGDGTFSWEELDLVDELKRHFSL